MQQSCTNIYKTARANAGLTQERAAELLALSVESVKAYETGVRVPPASTVAAMSEVYGSPGLRLEHARATDELGIIPEAARPREFPLAAMQFYNYLLDWAGKHRGQQILKIAEDGVVDENERPLYDEIVCELEGMAAALLSLMCCEGAKRERPEEAPSKRSVVNGSPVHGNHAFIIAQTRENASKIVRKKAVNAP